MKRRNLRGVCCACLALGLLISAFPAMAQTAAPAAPKPAATAAKPAAKKVVRWSRWRRPVRYRYSRWARPAVRKPATAWHPVYAAKPAAKPAWHPAYAAKPTAKPVWHPAYAAKPAAKPAWHPATTAKTAAWAKPVQKPAAAAWHGSAQANHSAQIATSKAPAKPVAKPKPAVSKAVAKPAAKPQPAPLSMTRDANNGSALTTADSPIAGGGQDMGGTILRWIFWPIVVLLGIAGGLYAGRRFRLLPTANAGAVQQGNAQNGNGLGQGVTPVFSNLAGTRAVNNGPANTVAFDQSGIGDGGLKIVGMQPLPGSGTTIYLVQIEDHMVLLGASEAGGVRTLAEWEQDHQPAVEKEKAAFDSFLRQQGINAVTPREDEEEHTFASIRARLNSTADRLAGLRADFGS